MDSSDLHGARLDDELKHETEGLVRGGKSTHAEEWKDKQYAGEDMPDVDMAPDGTLVGGTPPGMSEEDVAERSDVARFLGKGLWPADRESVLDLARTNEAPDPVLATLERLPAGQQFENLQEVWTALGHSVESERF